MTKNKKILVIVIALILISVILYFVFRKKSDPQVEMIPLPDGSVAPVSQFIAEQFPLNVGMQGENIRRLQVAINRLNKTSAKIAEDGVFGAETKRKLLLSVPTTQSGLPMSEVTLNAIIAAGNKA